MKTVLILFALIPSLSFAQNSILKAPKAKRAAATTSSTATIPTATARPTGQQSLSENLYFPRSGGLLISIRPQTISSRQEYKTSGSDVARSRQIDGQIYVLSLDHGTRNSPIALHAEISTGETTVTDKDTSTATGKNKGVGDLGFAMTKMTTNNKYNLFTGASVTLSHDTGKWAYDNKEGNLSSGGNSITPFMAMETKTRLGAAGGKISYQIWDKRTVTAAENVDVGITGGNTFQIKGFSEAQLDRNIFGGSLALNLMDGLSYDTKFWAKKFNSDSTQSVTGSIYSRLLAANNVTIKPEVTYERVLNSKINDNSYSTNDNMTLAIGVGASF
ncbi:MAG: hypothetical protein COT73_11285 [Bdellovibrio sp. CG10_big_fil_rev_8_21_14_0_10_47_8]|nr:MAG: hypothetical protein COT73_11285 [Bdellovibrio sp. CG10_big_fil_rev_8_21_14_0_10_47_8]